MTEFTSRISSGGLINIPQSTRDMCGFSKGDLVEVEVHTVRRVEGTDENGDPVYGEPQKPVNTEDTQ